MPSFFQNLFKKDPDQSSVDVTDMPPDRLSEPTSLLSAMNPSSPFAAAAAAGEQFTIRELTMLLPPQFVKADAMPGDQPVALPMDMLRHSMEQGRPALRLSQIYLACPFLFNRQVQPNEDVEIALPWQKVKRMLDHGGNAAPASPFAAAGPAPGRMDSPFAAAASPFMPVSNPAASPFAVRSVDPPPQNEVLSPFSAEALPPLEAAPPAPPANPFQRMEVPAEPPRPASPFQLVTPAAELPPAGSQGHSPFAHANGTGNGNGNGNGNGKARTAPVPTTPAPVPVINPFETSGAPPVRAPFTQPAAPAPAPAAAPVTRTAPVPAPAPAPAPVASMSPAGVNSQRITVMLSALLREVTAEELGFDPAAVPDHVEAELSLDTILPQLATGRVEVAIEELRQGVVDRFRPAFARVRAGMRFNVPLSEIFKSLPENAIPSPQSPPVPHIPIRTSPFQTPFALKAEEDEPGDQPALPSLVSHAPPAPAAPLPSFPVPPSLDSTPRAQSVPISLPSVPSASATHEPAPPTPAPSMTPPTSPPNVAPVKLPGMPSLPKLPNIPGMSSKPSPFSRPPGMAPAAEAAAPPAPFSAPPATLPAAPGTESHDDLGQTFSAGSLRAEPPAPAAEPFNPAKLFADAGQSSAPLPFSRPPQTAPAAAPAAQPAPAHQPAPAPAAHAPAARHAHTPAPAAAPPIEFNFGETPDLSRVLMRALFETDQDLTAHQIVDCIAQLPGLRSAVAIINGGVIASGHASGSEEVVQFTSSAPKSCEYLGGLAESMGYGPTGSFTLRAGTGIRTFFIENGHCLAVLHAKPAFAPGVRDKLLLVARSLCDLAD